MGSACPVAGHRIALEQCGESQLLFCAEPLCAGRTVGEIKNATAPKITAGSPWSRNSQRQPAIPSVPSIPIMAPDNRGPIMFAVGWATRNVTSARAR